MDVLSGKVIAFTGARRKEELSRLIEKQGGTPLLRPAQGPAFIEGKQLEKDVKHMVDKESDWFVLTTGQGIQALFDVAARIGYASEFHYMLSEANLAVRGYKTAQVLRKYGLEVDIRAGDGTNAGLINALKSFHFAEKKVCLQLHGGPVPRLVDFFQNRGASCTVIHPYYYESPDEDTVRKLIEELLNDKIDVTAFTSATQVHFLFQYARERGVLQSVIDAFTDRVLAAAVGKVTAEAIQEEGVERVVVPAQQRMGAMVIAIVDYYAGRK